MLIKEQQLINNKKYKSLHYDTVDDDFIILDDKTHRIDNSIKKIIDAINKFGYQVNVLDSKIIINGIINNFIKDTDNFDTIVAVGAGGKIVYKQLKNNIFFKDKEVYMIKWNRIWMNNECFFETNIDEYNIENKKILVLEDVIASGKTLHNLINYLNCKNHVVAVYNLIIQQTSPLAKKSFVPIFSGIQINSNDLSLDPYWYPPIYSLRHLLHGDLEVSNFYEVLNDKYFNNSRDVELLIKKERK